MSEHIVEIAVHPDVMLDEDRIRHAACRAANLPTQDFRAVRVLRRGIDARRGRVRVIARVQLLTQAEPTPKVLPPQLRTLEGAASVIIVGAGPTGLFCAHRLAQLGIRTAVLERGADIRRRRRDVAALCRHGDLNPESNYCFGEGGAGTFSDGKLYTRSNKRGDVTQVLRTFVAYGASPEILIDARPHIGTNRLPAVIGAMRQHLQDAGVEFHFNTRAEGLVLKGRRVRGVTVDGAVWPARSAVLAVGHSARDVMTWVQQAGAKVRFKPFAVGVRVEHSQSFIDRCQFGALAGHPALGAAAYRLVQKTRSGGAFSFCMCPGGFVAPAATEQNHQVVNGWSPSKRSGRFANSGLVTSVDEDALLRAGLDPSNPLSGVEIQRRLESSAYEAGGSNYGAPAQTLGSWVKGGGSDSLPDTSYPRPVRASRLDEVLREFAQPIREALTQIDQRMGGFVSEQSVALGVETRTSSPIRIDRDRESLQALGVVGLYPGGEGAGFAGGIMSAAIDGTRIANAIAAEHGLDVGSMDLALAKET